MTDQLAVRNPGALTFLTDTGIITLRNIRRIVRTPRLLYFASIQPVIFLILFRYVFGGAIRTPGYSYANYLLPGLLVEAVGSWRSCSRECGWHRRRRTGTRSGR